jgi:hypothetical protein
MSERKQLFFGELQTAMYPISRLHAHVEMRAVDECLGDLALTEGRI